MSTGVVPSGRTPGAALRWLTVRSRALRPRREDMVAMARSPRRDLVAGVTVGVVALPLALAFGITSGMGATAGLVTAIVAGTLAALFGGSNVQVSGPTGAMTVVLVPIVASHGANGVLVVGLMAGALLVAMAYAGLGRYVRYIPLPVIEGFTLGIAVIIGLQQVPAALGVEAEGEQVVLVAARALGAWVQDPVWAALLLTVAVATPDPGSGPRAPVHPRCPARRGRRHRRGVRRRAAGERHRQVARRAAGALAARPDLGGPARPGGPCLRGRRPAPHWRACSRPRWRTR